MVCAQRAQMWKSQKGQFMRNDLGTSKSWKCVQGWQAPMEQSKNSVLTCENMFATFKGSRATGGGKWNELSATR
jgi:hypothetical protein